MNTNRTIKKLILGAMILLMAALLVNKAVYIHVHVLADGSLVTHAHPFNKTSESSPGQSHHHSSLELLILEGFELMIISALLAFSLLSFARDVEKRWFIQKQAYPVLLFLRRGRAPPHCM